MNSDVWKYYNLSKRTDWVYEFYHYGQEFYDYQEVETSNGNTSLDLFPSIRYQSIGISIDPSYAINKFQRFNYGFDFRVNSKQNIIWTSYYENTEEPDKDYFKLKCNFHSLFCSNSITKMFFSFLFHPSKDFIIIFWAEMK